VFFEEWDDPLIAGICWVDELVEIAGGDPVLPALRRESLARARIVDPAHVATLAPDVVIGSWCGKAVSLRRIRERPGWADVPAVRTNRLFEVKSTYILQPGPAALTEGVRQLHGILARVTGVEPPAPLRPERLPSAADAGSGEPGRP
jgi:iron complex transport system substrate-binding protein